MSSAPGYKVKVLLAGPSKTGKTAIANFLADATEVVSGMDTDYWPTHVVRILEFEQVQTQSKLKQFAKRKTKRTLSEGECPESTRQSGSGIVGHQWKPQISVYVASTLS